LKVLLTGASGFVGSHILDSLQQNQIQTVVLLRSTTTNSFLQPHLSQIEVRRGSVTDPSSLIQATAGVTHVVHCAGLTKALKAAEFFQVNQGGTRNVVEALNAQGARIERLLHISSLAVSGPATPANPATEEASPRPVSTYGQSKLAGELEVRERCRVPFTILRPPAVYGPRDTGFLSLFKAVSKHLLPRPDQQQVLSIVYSRDLADAVVKCLSHPKTAGKTYFVASPQTVTSCGMAEEIAAQMKRWTIPCPIPTPVLWAVCLLQQGISQLTRRPSLLNLQKYAELRAPGWVCDASRFSRETGFECQTRLKQGIGETLDWYTRQGWL
jgi:nucleoside-diphosphate-sugar epimerase